MRVERLTRSTGPIYLRFGGIVTDPVTQGLDAELLAPHEYNQRVLASLRDVTLLNSSGIGMLLKIHREIQDRGGRLVLVDLPPSVRQVIDFMKLGSVLNIADNEQQAHEMLG